MKWVVEVRVEDLDESLMMCVVATSRLHAQWAAVEAYNRLDYVVEYAEATEVAVFPNVDNVINAIS